MIFIPNVLGSNELMFVMTNTYLSLNTVCPVSAICYVRRKKKSQTLFTLEAKRFISTQIGLLKNFSQ